MQFQESQTYKNLLRAFEGESKAHTKYDFYSIKAREDGFEQIANIFDQTSVNEREHAEIWFKWLAESDELPPTLENLQDSAANETYEWSKMYRGFATTARQEGYCELARLFKMVGNIEKNHSVRFETLADNVETSQVFEKDNKVTWICQACGYETFANSSPEICPVCEHPQSFTEIKATNY